jgi:cellulose synthase/poly-beta-1,6-N-acetylglucosamine synthase-like glycosyltransferase
MILIALIITLLYLTLIGSFIYGFGRIAPFHLEDVPPKTTFSVVIPFRDEAENLPQLLQTIFAIQYPKHLFEIIFVDDFSEDDSVKTINNFKAETNFKNIRIVKNERQSNAPKKDAITKAIDLAQYDWIITTDADCILPKYWLGSFDAYIQKNQVSCIVAPITYQVNPRFLQQFQLLDIMSLQGATIGSFGISFPFLCNGANFAYKKELFHELNGFENNNNIASGDDIFLLEKALKANAKQVHYLKCKQAIVTTYPQPSWPALISQRKRWAAKINAYNNGFGKITGFLVLLMNALLICSLIFTVFDSIKFMILCYILMIKFSIDFILIFKAAAFLNKKIHLKSYILSFILYPFFSVYIAFASMFGGFKWKGRAYSK